jgi:hypothetical protein
MDLLFKVGAACKKYKYLKNTYDFKNKVLAVIKAQYGKVTGPGSHPSFQNPGDHEEVLPVDEVAARLYLEYQEAVNIQEALQHDNLMKNVNNTSQFLASHLRPFPVQQTSLIILCAPCQMKHHRW